MLLRSNPDSRCQHDVTANVNLLRGENPNVAKWNKDVQRAASVLSLRDVFKTWYSWFSVSTLSTPRRSASSRRPRSLQVVGGFHLHSIFGFDKRSFDSTPRTRGETNNDRMTKMSQAEGSEFEPIIKKRNTADLLFYSRPLCQMWLFLSRIPTWGRSVSHFTRVYCCIVINGGWKVFVPNFFLTEYVATVRKKESSWQSGFAISSSYNTHSRSTELQKSRMISWPGVQQLKGNTFTWEPKKIWSTVATFLWSELLKDQAGH